MNDLEQYFKSNNDRWLTKWMGYFSAYEKHFSRFRNKPIHFLEIGVNQGGSLQMWKNYFGDQARIYGIDIDHRCKDFEEDRIKVFIGSQEDRGFWQDLKKVVPKFDIILDDGGHTMKQQIVTFEEMFSHVADDGLYMCEDLHTSYWPTYGGGYKNPDSFIEYSKNFIDYLHAWRTKERDKFQVNSFTRSVSSIHFYESIIAIEKSPVAAPSSETTGDRSYNFDNQESLQKTLAARQNRVDREDRSTGSLRSLGDVLLEDKQYSKAIAIYSESIQVEQHPASYLGKGIAQRQLEDYAGAIKSLEKSIALLNRYPFSVYAGIVYQELQLAYTGQREFAKAAEICRKLLSLEPNNASHHVSLAMHQTKLKELDEAILNFRKAIELNPGSFQAYHYLGNALVQKADKSAAAKAYEKAIEIRPNSPQIKEKLMGIQSEIEVPTLVG